MECVESGGHILGEAERFGQDQKEAVLQQVTSPQSASEEQGRTVAGDVPGLYIKS